MLAQDLGDDVPSTRGVDAVQDGLIADQHPFPGHARALLRRGQPRPGFVAADDRGLEQPLHDRRLDPLQRAGGPAQRVGDGTFADAQGEQLGHQPGEPFIVDGVVMVQVGQQGQDRRAKGRAGRHRVGRHAAHPPPAVGTAPTE